MLEVVMRLLLLLLKSKTAKWRFFFDCFLLHKAAQRWAGSVWNCLVCFTLWADTGGNALAVAFICA
jgi:hypothetical protein